MPHCRRHKKRIINLKVSDQENISPSTLMITIAHGTEVITQVPWAMTAYLYK